MQNGVKNGPVVILGRLEMNMGQPGPARREAGMSQVQRLRGVGIRSALSDSVVRFVQHTASRVHNRV